MTTIVTDDPDASRYEIRVDGELAGFAEYHLYKGVAAFTHTEIRPEFEGHGLASTLIRHALDDARRRRQSVEPFCPFVRSFIAKHHEYRYLVPKADWPRFSLADEAGEPISGRRREA